MTYVTEHFQTLYGHLSWDCYHPRELGLLRAFGKCVLDGVARSTADKVWTPRRLALTILWRQRFDRSHQQSFVTEAENGWGIIQVPNGAQKREQVTGQAGDPSSNCSTVLAAGHGAGDLILLSSAFIGY